MSMRGIVLMPLIFETKQKIDYYHCDAVSSANDNNSLTSVV